MNIHPLRSRSQIRAFNVNTEGFIISNSDLIISNNERYFNHWQTDPFSLEYIQTELMLSKNADSSMVLNQNTNAYSPFASKIIQEILSPTVYENSTSSTELIIEYFENWNYIFDSNSSAATLFEYFYQSLLKNVFLDDIGDAYFKEFRNLHGLHSVLLLYCLSNNSAVFDDKTTSIRETKEEQIQRALEQALMAVKRQFGTETEEWRWENYLLLSQNYSNLKGIHASTKSDLIRNDEFIPNYGHWSSLLKLKNALLYREKEIMYIKKLLYVNTFKNRTTWIDMMPRQRMGAKRLEKSVMIQATSNN
jgi:acyl-homoserine lactone acylase PvdQ